MKTSTQTILDEIKYKIESAGYKMSDLCNVAQIHPSQVSRWQAGNVIPLYTNIVKLQTAADELIKARMLTINKAMEDAFK